MTGLTDKQLIEWAGMPQLSDGDQYSYRERNIARLRNHRTALAREVMAMRHLTARLTTLVELGMTYVTEPEAYEFMWKRLETELGYPPRISREIVPQATEEVGP